MRIPSTRVHHTMMSTLSSTLARIERVQMELASGKRILKPSDDPAGAVRILSLERMLDENRQYQRNISDGLRWEVSTEGALTTVTEVLMQLKEIATRGANEVPEERAVMGTTVSQLLEELLDQSEAQIDDRYLFSGFSTSTAPFEASTVIEGEGIIAGAVGVPVDLTHARIVEGSVVVTDEGGTTVFVEGTDYSIDYATGRLTLLAGGGMTEGAKYLVGYETETVSSVEAASVTGGEIVRQVADGSRVTVNLLGTDVFQGTVDLFQLGIDLKNALWKDDADAVRSLLDTIDGAIDQVAELLGVVGTRTQRLEGHQQRLGIEEIALEEFISEIEHVDLAAAVVQLQAEQLAYESALATTARLMQISMINYL